MWICPEGLQFFVVKVNTLVDRHIYLLLLVTGLPGTALLYKHLTRPLRASVCTAW